MSSSTAPETIGAHQRQKNTSLPITVAHLHPHHPLIATHTARTAISTLAAAAIESCPLDMYPQTAKDRNIALWSAGNIAAELAKPTSFYVGAYAEGDSPVLLGAIWGEEHPVFPGGHYLSWVVVDAQARGAGIAPRLIEEYCRLVPRLTAHTIARATIRPMNNPSHAAFRKSGWTIERKDEFFPTKGLSYDVVVKDLAA